MRRFVFPLILILILCLPVFAVGSTQASLHPIALSQVLDGVTLTLVKAERVNGKLPKEPWGDRRYNETSERLELVFLVGRADGKIPKVFGMVRVPLETEADLIPCETNFYNYPDSKEYMFKISVLTPRLPKGIDNIDIIYTMDNNSVTFPGVRVGSALAESGPNAPVFPVRMTPRRILDDVLQIIQRKDPVAIRAIMGESGLDLGYDILCSQDLVNPNVVFEPVGDDTYISAVIRMFDQKEMKFHNYSILMRHDVEWKVIGLFPERPYEQQVR